MDDQSTDEQTWTVPVGEPVGSIPMPPQPPETVPAQASDDNVVAQPAGPSSGREEPAQSDLTQQDSDPAGAAPEPAPQSEVAAATAAAATMPEPQVVEAPVEEGGAAADATSDGAEEAPVAESAATEPVVAETAASDPAFAASEPVAEATAEGTLADTSAAPESGATAPETTDESSNAVQTVTAVQELQQHVNESLTQLNAAVQSLAEQFRSRFQYDTEKEKIIDQQHDELKELREGLKRDLLRPVLYDIADTLDDIRKSKQHYAQTDAGDTAVKALNDVEDMLAYVLEKNDIERVISQPGEKFLAVRHRMVKHEDTDNPELVGTIVRSIAPGYMLGAEALYKEKVVVYRAAKNPQTQK